MKKMILMLMALMMAMTALPVMAEEEMPESVAVEGFVLEILDGSILLQTSTGEPYEVLLNEETVIDGKELAIGDCITVPQ